VIIFGYRGRPAPGRGGIVLAVGALLVLWKWLDPGRDRDGRY
jgi:hypothetical protein